MTHEEELLHKRLKRLLNNSEEGKVTFKNYKDLCTQLKLPYKGGESKKAQLKHLQYFIKLQKGEKKELYYTEVETDPDNNMIQENTILLNIERILLLNFLSVDNNEQQMILMNDFAFWKLFGFINYKFSDKKKEKDFKNKEGINRDYLLNMKEKTTGRFQDILESAFKKMQDRAYIKYIPAEIVTYEDGREREATEEEMQEVLNIENELMQEMGYTSKKQIRLIGRLPDFYEKRFKRIQEKHTDWRHYSLGFKIILSDKKWLKQGLSRNLNEQKTYQINNNEQIHDLLIKSANTTYNNYQKQLELECAPYLRFRPNDTIEEWKKHTDIYKRKGEIMENEYLSTYNHFLEEFVDLQKNMRSK